MEEKAMQGYKVVLRYTKDAGVYAGVVTWTTFNSKKEFDKIRKSFLQESNQEVVEEGECIDIERIEELVSQTPLSSLVRFALHKATNPKNGVVNDDILRMELVGIFIMEGF
jgi:hypothetical protein